MFAQVGAMASGAKFEGKVRLQNSWLLRSSLVLRKRVFVMTSAFSWQNSISLCPASFRIPRPNLPITPGVS